LEVFYDYITITIPLYHDYYKRPCIQRFQALESDVDKRPTAKDLTKHCWLSDVAGRPEAEGNFMGFNEF
jgi:hypothetical protein